MVHSSSLQTIVPETDLLSYVFDSPDYDRNKEIYIDALVENRKLSANQVLNLVRQLIAGLKAHGVQKGDCILVHSFSDIMYPVLYLGIIGAGASFVGSNPSNTTQELAHLLTLTSARYIITSAPQLSTLLSIADDLPHPIPRGNIFIFNTPHNPNIPTNFRSWQTLLEYGEETWEKFDNGKRSKETIASLFSTSGTTGLPKVATVSHYACIARCISSHDPRSKPYAISRLLCLPMFHGVAATASHIDPIRYGIPTYILPRFSLDPFLSAIQHYQITETSMVPAVMSMILQNEAGSETEMKRSLATLRFVRCAGAPLDIGVQKSFQAWLSPEARIARAWGMTELGSLTSFLHGEVDETGSCGRLLTNMEAMIIDSNGHEIDDEGVSGEVLARGPSLMNQYLGNEKATRDMFRNGWLRTGDIAYCKKGRWYVVGRSKDMIKVRGWQVAPAELETCLLQHPQVMDVSVIGIKSTKQETELPRAYIVLKPSHNYEQQVMEEELKSFLSSRLAHYKALEGGVKLVNSLPKTASGKTIKTLLREQAAQELNGNA
ncbi:4-coumarate-CoA ligase 2 [Phlyctema vagabunda]|uniref:4-coumarate-CoA ligase 2 n=1 Tax=Phlyctema vagabunda TaxID=108571 RepID=A0ABR4P8N7_9HELO